MAFKPHIGVCSCGCGREGVVCVKAGYIQQCNERIKKERKANERRVKPITAPIKDFQEKMRVFARLKRKYQPKALKSVNGGGLKRKTGIKNGFRKRTGEKEVFLEIWNERPHMSEISGIAIKEPKAINFMHILSKKAYPGFRLRKENIMLGTESEHMLYDNGSPKGDIWRKVFEKKEKLKQLYYHEFRNKNGTAY